GAGGSKRPVLGQDPDAHETDSPQIATRRAASTGRGGVRPPARGGALNFAHGAFMIEVENLTKRYGRHTAVDGVSFRVHKGEILGFLGPNGAGKTTTMRILTCSLPPTDGTARGAGYDVCEQPLEVKRRVGYTPETPPLYPDMDVQTFLDFCAKIKGVPAATRKSKIAEAVEKTRIGDVRT